MEIRQLSAFGDAAAGRWHDALLAGATADRHAPIVTPRDNQLASLAADATNPNRHREAWGAWDGEVCVGAMLVEWPLRENRRSAEIEVLVPPSHRRRGVGAALWETGVALVRAEGRTTLTVEVNVPRGLRLDEWPGGRFALARGFTTGLTEARLVLDLPMTAPWPDLAAPGYRALAWHGPTPPEWLEALATLHNGMAADVPTGSLAVEAASWDAERVSANEKRMASLGYGLLTTLVLSSVDSPAAYTTMFVAGDGRHVQQDDTYVRLAHRGHRLGTLAKAHNLRSLAAHYPDAQHVHTWTAESNDTMRTINEAFGFHEVEVMHDMQAREALRAQ